jgi:hypothetical protein
VWEALNRGALSNISSIDVENREDKFKTILYAGRFWSKSISVLCLYKKKEEDTVCVFIPEYTAILTCHGSAVVQNGMW